MVNKILHCSLVLLILLTGCKSRDSKVMTTFTSETVSSSSNIILIVDNPTGENVFFQWFSLFNPGDVLPYQSAKKKDTLEIFSVVPIQLNTITGRTLPFVIHNYFLAGGDTIVLNTQKEQAPKIYTLSNNPTKNNELDFFVKYRESFGNYEGFGVELPFKNLNYIDRITKIKELYIRNIAFLHSYSKKHEISDTFIKQIEDVFYYKQYTDFFYNYDLVSDKQIINSSDVQSFVSEFKQNDNTLSLSEYALALQQILKFNVSKNESEFKADKIFLFAKDYFKGKTRDLILYKIIYESVYLSKENTPPLIEEFLSISETPYLKTEVEENLKEYSRIVKQEKNKDLQKAVLTDYLAENIQNWSDFLNKSKGSVTYLDFWASWCGPCIQELPASFQMKEEFKNKPILFAYFSIDDKRSNWKKAVEKYGLENDKNNYLLGAGSQSIIASHYKVVEIPRYLIFDKNGKLVNSNAPRPSDPKLKEILNKLVMKP